MFLMFFVAAFGMFLGVLAAGPMGGLLGMVLGTVCGALLAGLHGERGEPAPQPGMQKGPVPLAPGTRERRTAA